jgi:hypothetical protein
LFFFIWPLFVLFCFIWPLFVLFFFIWPLLKRTRQRPDEKEQDKQWSD